jgi:hypothetical protein
MKDEVIEAAQLYGEHHDQCPICSQDGMSLCFKGEVLMQRFYDALKDMLNRGAIERSKPAA